MSDLIFLLHSFTISIASIIPFLELTLENVHNLNISFFDSVFFSFISTRGYKILLPIINLLNKKYNKKILEFVIGGNRYKLLRNNKFYYKQAKKIEKIYVETEKMKNEYKRIGFNNVETVPNFKCDCK